MTGRSTARAQRSVCSPATVRPESARPLAAAACGRGRRNRCHGGAEPRVGPHCQAIQRAGALREAIQCVGALREATRRVQALDAAIRRARVPGGATRLVATRSAPALTHAEPPSGRAPAATPPVSALIPAAVPARRARRARLPRAVLSRASAAPAARSQSMPGLPAAARPPAPCKGATSSGPPNGARATGLPPQPWQIRPNSRGFGHHRTFGLSSVQAIGGPAEGHRGLRHTS